MAKIISILGCAVLAGCASRSKYEPYGSSGGYSEAAIDKRIMVARFSGNAYTVASDANIFSQFRAVEVCEEKGFRVTRFFGTQNKTVSKDIQRSHSETSASPQQINGTGYSYGNNVNINGTISGGNSTTNSSAWTQTLKFPTFDTYFTCTNEAYLTKFLGKPVSAEQMKPLVKDLMGAVQVQEIMDGSPNKGVLHVGDIVYKINDERIASVPQLSAIVDSASDKNKIQADIFRDGNAMKVLLQAEDGTQNFAKASEDLKTRACQVPEVKKRPVCSGRFPASPKD